MLIIQGSCLLFLLLIGFSAADNRSVRASIEIDYYYTVDSSKDADYFVSQVLPELENPDQSLQFFTLPIGGVEIITDNQFKVYCHSKKDVCETSKLQYCISNNNQNTNVFKNFLKCYFQSEFFPVNILEATKSCLISLQGQSVWDKMEACSQDEATMANYFDIVRYNQQLRPLIIETPHVYLNDDSSALAVIDLKKALCRVTATDIWSCESVDQYKEPLVEIFYNVYEDEAKDFFNNRLTLSVLSKLLGTTSRLDVIPNPNKVLGCNSTTDDVCWSHQAHWCISEDYGNVDQLSIIQCTFGKPDSLSAKDKIKQCVNPDKLPELVNCIDQTIGASSGALKAMQNKLNILVEPAAQTAVEVIIKGDINLKVKSNGILEEICYNYMHIDDETIGCKVTRPKVQIFYEANSPSLSVPIGSIVNYPLLTPFETIADFEFIPYGNTKYEGGNYTCQSDEYSDGEKRCYANFVHACLLKNYYKTVTDKFHFFNFFLCTADFAVGTDPVDQAEICLNQYYENGPSMWGVLHTCALLDDDLKTEMRTKTESISITAIPEITVDGVKKTTEVGDNLLGYLCQVESDATIKPRACSNFETIPGYQSETLDVTLYISGDQRTASFVQSQIDPLVTSAEPRDTSTHLREVINWQIVPWGGQSYYNDITDTIICTNPSECLINRVLACTTRSQQNGLLGAREDRQRVVNFLVCFFDKDSGWLSDPLKAGLGCSRTLSSLDSYPQLWQCAVDANQQALMREMRDLTENNYPALTIFPALAINRQQVSLSSDGDGNLVQLLCTHYFQANMKRGGNVPVECTDFIPTTVSPPGGKAFQHSCQTLFAAVFSYFVLSLSYL